MFLIMFLASKSWHFPKEILGLLCFLFLILKSYMLLIFSTSFSLLDTLSVRVKPNELKCNVSNWDWSTLFSELNLISSCEKENKTCSEFIL